MPVNIAPSLNLGRIAAAAVAGGAGQAYRQNLMNSIAQQTRVDQAGLDRQFSAQQRQSQNAYDLQRMGLMQGFEQQQAQTRQESNLDYLSESNRLAEERAIREAERDAKLREAGYVAQYSARQQAERQALEASIDSLSQRPEISDYDKRRFLMAGHAQLAGIQPRYVKATPKPEEVMDQYIKMPDGQMINVNAPPPLYTPVKETLEQKQQRLDLDEDKALSDAAFKLQAKKADFVAAAMKNMQITNPEKFDETVTKLRAVADQMFPGVGGGGGQQTDARAQLEALREKLGNTVSTWPAEARAEAERLGRLLKGG
jgi:hypothetical protein